ncbi:MAG TPA: 5-oxoprolinase subunit PxpB [Gemmatimonadales bacterium]|nr:5-oxoprolinase subunit PxpB [Gemmatimonadales bacterium]
MSGPPAAILPLGEAGWSVVLGSEVDAATQARVLALRAAIAAAELPGVRELVPAYTTVTVWFDPSRSDPEALRTRLGALALATEAPGTGEPAAPARDPLVIPTVYDGPDLDEVAARTGLTRDEVIRRHCGPDYLVYLLGFAPGFAYLGPLDPALVLPRRPAPRLRVPPGSVAIAGAQTAVYPLATPGGWHLLGHTALRLFDPERRPPALLAPGDRVRFEPLP